MSELYSLLEDFREDYRNNPSFGSIILEDLYTSSGRIIILPIGRYLHVLTFLSGVYLHLKEEQLYISCKKFESFAPVLDILGCKVDTYGVHANSDKMAKVRNLAVPT